MAKIIPENLNTPHDYIVRMVKITLNWEKIAEARTFIEKKSDDSNFVLTKLSSKSESASPQEFAWYRSVIWERRTAWEKDGGRDADMIVNYLPVSVAPAKAWDYVKVEGEGEGISGQANIDGAWVEDFVEGTMVNVFVTAEHPEPQVATRSSLGATGTFYSQRSFMELFKDGLAADGKILSADVFPLGNCEARFWSFVLRHPDNRFVEPVAKPTLVLIHEGWTNTDGSVEINQRPQSSTSWQLPIKYDCEPNIDAVKARLNVLGEAHGPTWQGMVLRMADGNRIKFVQSTYTRLRNWRQEPLQDSRLLWLVRENSKIVAEYMKYFPEDLERFLVLNRMMGRICRELYTEYQEVHIRHNKKSEEARDFYRPHIFALHGLYLNTLKPKGWFVRAREVRDYLNGLPWQRVNYIIRRIEGKVAAPVAT